MFNQRHRIRVNYYLLAKTNQIPSYCEHMTINVCTKS
uniref:Uncharacterized protein n=1 Tax=Arundo donax TaxID=35708 RepID=A0A0A9CHF2_ARUDO